MISAVSMSMDEFANYVVKRALDTLTKNGDLSNELHEVLMSNLNALEGSQFAKHIVQRLRVTYACKDDQDAESEKESKV